MAKVDYSDYTVSPTGKKGNDRPSGYKYQQTSNYTPQQHRIHQQRAAELEEGSYLSRLANGDESMFEELERPALRQFGQAQAGLASRFSAQGQGGRHSSGFRNSMNASTRDFAEKLQANRLNLRNQAMRDLHTMSSQLLEQRPYDTQLVKKQGKENFWQKATSTVLPIAGAVVGGIYGGPQGAEMGYQAGQGTAAGINGLAAGGGYSGATGQAMANYSPSALSGGNGLPTSWGDVFGGGNKGSKGQSLEGFQTGLNMAGNYGWGVS